jgi:acetolactate synthase-1/3 small subunit
MRHVICAQVENKPGVLAHISGLFSGRGFNIDSLTVGRTENPAVSRMTIVVTGDDAVLEQVRKQLEKLISVLKVTDFSDKGMVERDLMLIRVNVPPAKRPEVTPLIEVFGGKVVDISQTDMVIELSGPEAKIDTFVEMVQPYGIKEMVRTGIVAMTRAEHNNSKRKRQEPVVPA